MTEILIMKLSLGVSFTSIIPMDLLVAGKVMI